MRGGFVMVIVLVALASLAHAATPSASHEDFLEGNGTAPYVVQPVFSGMANMSIRVDSRAGNDTAGCGADERPCRTLETAMMSVTEPGFRIVLAAGRNHTLVESSLALFAVEIVGEGDEPVVVQLGTVLGSGASVFTTYSRLHVHNVRFSISPHHIASALVTGGVEVVFSRCMFEIPSIMAVDSSGVVVVDRCAVYGAEQTFANVWAAGKLFVTNSVFESANLQLSLGVAWLFRLASSANSLVPEDVLVFDTVLLSRCFTKVNMQGVAFPGMLRVEAPMTNPAPFRGMLTVVLRNVVADGGDKTTYRPLPVVSACGTSLSVAVSNCTVTNQRTLPLTGSTPSQWSWLQLDNVNFLRIHDIHFFNISATSPRAHGGGHHAALSVAAMTTRSDAQFVVSDVLIEGISLENYGDHPPHVVPLFYVQGPVTVDIGHVTVRNSTMMTMLLNVAQGEGTIHVHDVHIHDMVIVAQEALASVHGRNPNPGPPFFPPPPDWKPSFNPMVTSAVFERVHMNRIQILRHFQSSMLWGKEANITVVDCVFSNLELGEMSSPMINVLSSGDGYGLGGPGFFHMIRTRVFNVAQNRVQCDLCSNVGAFMQLRGTQRFTSIVEDCEFRHMQVWASPGSAIDSPDSGSVLHVFGGPLGHPVVIRNTVFDDVRFVCDDAQDCNGAALTLINNRVSLTDVVCQGGQALRGGCVSVASGLLTARNCTFRNNRAVRSSGVLVVSHTGSSVGFDMTDCLFENNYGPVGGVMSLDTLGLDVQAVFTRCTFRANSAATQGGVVSVTVPAGHVMSFTDCTFERNSATLGGALHIQGSPMLVLGSVFRRNQGSAGGGAIYITRAPNTMNSTIAWSRFEHNSVSSAGNGGAVLVEGQDADAALFDSCHFEHNRANGKGGALSAATRSRAQLFNCTFVANVAEAGAVAATDVSQPTITLCTFDGNRAVDGAGLHADVGTHVVVRDALFARNYATGRGGGSAVLNLARATFQDCAWKNNTAEQEGGALKVSWSADVVVEGLSRMVHNVADSGGAVHADLEAHVLLDEILLAFNDANRGGAVTVDDDAWIEMHGVDVRNNTAGHGGGVLLSRWRHAALHTCVFFGNSAFAKGGAVSIHHNTEPVDIQSCRFEFNDVVGALSTFDRNGGAAVYTQSASVHLWDAYAVGNVAPYGAGVFVDVNSASDVSILNATFDMNRATFGGGAVYWQVEGNGNDREAPIVVQRDVTRTHNTARYGRDMATSPQSLAFSIAPPSHLMGGEEDVVLRVEVRDHDNNRVDTDVFTDSYEVEMVVPAGIIVYGPKRVVSKQGIATFSFRIDGEVGTHAILFRTIDRELDGLESTQWNLALTPCAQGKRKVRLADGVPVCQFCPQGSYVLKRNATQECLPCPVGADCTGNSVIAERGYWLYEEPGGNVVSYTCEVNKCKLAQPNNACGNNCTVANQCAEHRHGRLCSGCEEGYQTVAWASGCIPCDRVRVGAIVGVIIAMWLFVLFQHFFVSQSAATVKLVFYYIQVSEVLTAGLPVTGGAAFNVMNFRGAMGVCLAPMSYYTRFLLVALTPVMLLAMLAITFGVHWVYVLWKRRRVGPHIERAVDGYVEFEGGRTGVQRVRIDAYIKTLWALGLFSYAPLTYEALGFFQCGHVGGENVMQSNPHILCDTAMYRDYVGLAAVLVVWAVAFPIAVVVQMQRLRGHFHEEAAIRRFSILFGGFRVRQWQAFSIVRLTILISVSTAHFSSSEGRHLALASLCFFIFCVHAQVQPYEQEWLNRLELWVLFMLTLVSFCVSFPSYYIEHTYLHVLTVTVPIVLLAALAVGVQQRKFATKLRSVRQKRLGSDPGAGTAMREASSSE